jgi:hypothetical protein
VWQEKQIARFVAGSMLALVQPATLMQNPLTGEPMRQLEHDFPSLHVLHSELQIWQVFIDESA